MQENQNTDGQVPPREVTPEEVKESHTPITPITSVPTPAEVKEEALTPETQPQTDSMEVHKHPHHVMHSKKWNEYLLEFFMIFFAVTMGFFAEQIRENYSEHQKAKQYLRSLHEDLSSDTTAVMVAIHQKTWIISKLDSLQQILALPDFSQYNDEVYYLERFLTKNEMFNIQDVTYQQLKSSGNFRYIENQELYKKVARYYNLYTSYQTLIESQFENINSLTAMESSLFDGQDLSGLNSNNPKSFYELFKRPENKLHLLTMDKKALNFLAIKVANAKMVQETNIVFLERIKQSATELLTEIDNQSN